MGKRTYYKKKEVYNIGGSRHSNISMNEAIACFQKKLDKKAKITYIDKNRIGDHIWYISDVSKFRFHYPRWNYKYSIDMIMDGLCTKLTQQTQ